MLDRRPNRARALQMLGRIGPAADTAGSTGPETNGAVFPRGNRLRAERLLANTDLTLAIAEAKSPRVHYRSWRGADPGSR